MLVGLVVLVVFYVASRLVARFAGDQLTKRHVRKEFVVMSRRVAALAVLVIGLFLAFGFALQSANVTLFGLLLATVVAAFGVQDLLKDYVSGYYIQLERHIRAGDRIVFDTHQGTVTEIRLRVTMLKADDGDVVIVPNSELFTKAVTIRTSQPEDVTTSSAPPA